MAEEVAEEWYSLKRACPSTAEELLSLLESVLRPWYFRFNAKQVDHEASNVTSFWSV